MTREAVRIEVNKATLAYMQSLNSTGIRAAEVEALLNTHARRIIPMPSPDECARPVNSPMERRRAA